jgi:competence protein ComFC
LKQTVNAVVVDAFGRVLADFVALHTALPPEVDVVVPIPTAYEREVVRGGGIPGRLARVMANWLGLPWEEWLVQTGIHVDHRERDPVARGRSLQAAWRVALPTAFQGARLLLVDDVLTTGLTARVAAQLLRTAGARSVHLVTLFHTERSH